MRYIFLLFILFILVASPAIAEVVFDDNFDTQADWTASVEECGLGCSDPPANWTFYRSTGSWESDTGGEDTISISSANARDGSGKALTVWNESRPGQSGWGADGMVSVLLDNDYTDLYIQVWIKYDPSWQAAAPADMMIKTFRVMHYDRSGNPFQFFTSGNSCPIYLYDLKNSNTYGTRLMSSFRCDMQESDYYCGNNDYMIEETDFEGSLYEDFYEPRIGDPGSYNDNGMPADGDWHKYVWHIKMNSYAGSGSWNTDGVLQLWIDDQLQTDISHMRWIESGTDSTIGWNLVGLGGNAYNEYSAEENKDEQWYAMDDFVVSTTPIASDYVIGSSTDTIVPTGTAFDIPATGSSLTHPINTFTCDDNIAVTGYLVNELASAPNISDAGWNGTAQTSYTFTTYGSKTLYGWCKDAAGNISSSLSDTTMITSPSEVQLLSAGQAPISAGEIHLQ